jgi:hypothetical protein
VSIHLRQSQALPAREHVLVQLAQQERYLPHDDSKRPREPVGASVHRPRVAVVRDGDLVSGGRGRRSRRATGLVRGPRRPAGRRPAKRSRVDVDDPAGPLGTGVVPEATDRPLEVRTDRGVRARTVPEIRIRQSVI